MPFYSRRATLSAPKANFHKDGDSAIYILAVPDMKAAAIATALGLLRTANRYTAVGWFVAYPACDSQLPHAQ